jgi:hypothetical protein
MYNDGCVKQKLSERWTATSWEQSVYAQSSLEYK